MIPPEYKPYDFIIAAFFGFLLFIISKIISRKKPVLSKKYVKTLNERKDYLASHVKNKKVRNHRNRSFTHLRQDLLTSQILSLEKALRRVLAAERCRLRTKRSLNSQKLENSTNNQPIIYYRPTINHQVPTLS